MNDHCIDLKELTICVVIKSNPNQWQTTAKLGDSLVEAMTQMIHDIMGVIPKEVVILTDQEVVFQNRGSILYNRSVQSAIQELFHWGGQSIMVDSVVATQDSITKIIKEQEVQREKQKELE